MIFVAFFAVVGLLYFAPWLGSWTAAAVAVVLVAIGRTKSR